jgi:general secretion pathway protein M
MNINVTKPLFHLGRLVRHPGIPALGYGALVIVLIVTVIFAVLNVTQRYRANLELAEVLARYQHHGSSSPTADKRAAGDEPQGSPFLQGSTVTVASAALLQRVTSAITRAGGNVVSSEVEPQDSHSADGVVRITATCEIEQETLQPLLYEIEAGMPFLFVDQFVAQASTSASENGRMRIMLTISGLWAGAKTR